MSNLCPLQPYRRMFLKTGGPLCKIQFWIFQFLIFLTLVVCPDKTFYTQYHGLINFEQISKRKITTKKFTLLPKSSATGVSTFIQKTKKVPFTFIRLLPSVPSKKIYKTTDMKIIFKKFQVLKVLFTFTRSLPSVYST